MNEAGALGLSGSVAVAGGRDGRLVSPGVGVHFAVLARTEGFAVLGCGWLSDPEGRVVEVAAGGEAGDPVELLRDALFVDDRVARAALTIPEDATPRRVFLFALADAPERWKGGLPLGLQLAGGGLAPGFAAAAGTAADLGPILDLLPAEEGLRFAAKVIGAWRRSRAPLAGVPRPLHSLFERIHERLDAAHNYGAAASVWPIEGKVESVLRVDRDGMLLGGWFSHGAGDAIAAAAAVSLFDRRIDLLLPLPRVARALKSQRNAEALRNTEAPRKAEPPRDPDAGFLVFAPAPELEAEDRFWFLEIALESGAMVRLPFQCPPAPPAMAGIEAAFDNIAPFEANMPRLEALFRDALAPAVDVFWARTRRDRPPPVGTAYGAVADRAEVSVIVPLYGRIDFMRHQIAAFSNDPEFRTPSKVELIYVLDDPGQSAKFDQLSRDLHAVYGVPFRTVALARNLGFSGANNAGATAASGTSLLFLNSDIVPRHPRWAGRLLQTYRSLDRCGILGCRLLLEDGAIQHAGMTFAPSLQQPQCWGNEHPGKGLPVAFDRARGPVRVPAVTGACLLIDRALLAQLGGWPEEYVVGDFEDSDLCLKAWQAGTQVYYTPDVELYHLERQSVKLAGQSDWRLLVTLYNEWKHARNWGAMIPGVLAALAGRSGA